MASFSYGETACGTPSRRFRKMIRNSAQRLPKFWVTEPRARAKLNIGRRRRASKVANGAGITSKNRTCAWRPGTIPKRHIADNVPLRDPRTASKEPRKMARVTVEDCIDKVENRFDLVLLASHRARMISSGTQIAVERDNDKNPVVALREIAEKAISPEDLKEELVHSLQKYVEVDEPEPETVPLIGAPGTGVDADDTDVTTDRMSEEELLKGLEGLTPPESQPEPDVGDEEE